MKKWKNLLAGLVVLALLLAGCSSVGQTADGSHAAGNEQTADGSYAAGNEQATGVSQATDGEQAAGSGQAADGSQPEVGGQPIGEAEGSGRLNVHYLDVGQGNAALLESEGHYMLIDGGNRKASSFVVSYLKRQNVESLDYILISHFDEDHLAGTIGASTSFRQEKSSRLIMRQILPFISPIRMPWRNRGTRRRIRPRAMSFPLEVLP